MRQLSHDLSSSYDSLSVDPLEGIFKDVTLRGTRAFDPWEISRACHTTATQAPMGIQCGPLASNSLAGLPMLAAPSTAIRAMKAISALHQCDFAFFLLRPWRAFFFFLASSVAAERFSASWRKMAPFSAAVTSFRVEFFDFDTLEIWCDEGLTAGDMMEQLGHSSLCASSRQMEGGGRTVRPRLESVVGVGMNFPPRPSNDFPDGCSWLEGSEWRLPEWLCASSRQMGRPRSTALSD